MGDILELETFLTLPHRDGEVRWSIKDAGFGPAIDGRLYKRGWKKLADGTWTELPADAPLRPGKAGLWVPIEQAEQLADALPFAVLRAYEYRSAGGYPADGGPAIEQARPGWDCGDEGCGAANIAEARACGRCGARKRVGVLA